MFAVDRVAFTKGHPFHSLICKHMHLKNGGKMKTFILLGLACFGLSACVAGNGFAPFITHSQANADSVQKLSIDGLGLVKQFSIEPGCVGSSTVNTVTARTVLCVLN